LTQIGSNTARIDVPDSTDEVTRTRIDIPSDSVAGFKSNGKKLEVKTRNARVDVPASSFISGQNAYFEMVPIKDTNSEASFKSRAASQMGRGNNTITIASRPVDIATNVQNKQVNVLIPLDASVRAADYHNLVVYVEHSDGTKEVLPNSALTVVDYDTTGTKAVQFTTTKFSTFGAMLAPDATAPTAGNSGAVQASNSTSSTVDVAWSAATDDVTAQASLQYKLVYSTSNNISTVDLANTNGTVASDWADNYTSATVSGLSGNTTYYFNVLVRDGAGNMTVYSGANATTLQAADTTPPIVGNSGTIDATNPTVSSIDLAWGRATDGRTAQANLEYRVVYSTTPGLTTVSAALSGGTIAKDWTANLTSLTVTGLNDSTTYYFNVLVRDASGNVSIYTMANQTTLVPPDTTAPNTPVITAPTPNQLMTHASPDLTGTAEPGATMTITVGGRTYTTTADANGDWSVHVSPDLPDGTYTASVTATDAAGNTSGAATVTFTIDTSLPTAPVFTAPTDHQLLSNPTPTIEGTAGAGLTIEVTVGGHTYVTTADAQGNWSITVNTPLPDGTYDAVAIAKDSHGIASPQATVTFEVDATPPQAPTILDPTANQVLTTGTPSIEGTAEPGSTVTITVGGNTFTTVANGQGSWSVVVSPALADGTYTATVTATDAAGNVSNPETVTFDIDTTPPADPVITSPTAGAVLSNNTPAITGTAIPGSTIIVTINGQTYTTTADPQGNWSVTVSPALPDGSYTASVTATDPAGNVSNASTVSFDIDTTPPADPVITSPTAGAVLSNNTPTIEGLAEPGSTVTVTINGQTYTTTADPQGNWSVTVSPALADGSYTASVTATDPAGNMSQASTVSFEIDSTPPTDPIITAPTANATLSNATPTIEGLAEPGSTVTVTINGQTYTTTADPQGNWSVTVSPALADGSYTASVIATDPAGNMSQASTVSFEIDTTPPADPIITAPTANATLSNATPTISGTAEPGSIVTVTINGQTYLTTADAQGNWSVSVSPALPDGSYTASVTATDASGNTSAASTISFKIDTTAPNAPSTPDLTTVSDSGASNTDNITADRTPTFTGTSEPNAIIELYADGVLVGTTIADGNGDWSVTADPMADGVYDFTVVAIDAVNNQSSPSQALSVTIDASAPGAPTLAASTTNPTADPVIITITYVSNATLNEYKLGAGGTWTTYTGPITITENIRIYARSTDDAGNTSSVPSLNVTNILNGPSSTPVYVNGTQFNVGSETLVGSVTVVQVDTNQMLASINQAVSNNPNATNNLVYVPVQSHSQNQVEVKLDAQTVTQLVNHDFDIKILTTLGSYTLPSEELSSSPIMKSNQAQLFVSITKSDAQQVATTNAIAKQQKINVVGNPVNFEVAIKTPHSTVRVNTFSRYVSRTIALPNNVDPNKITTGIVVNPNGTFAHIPTVVSYVGGKYFAQLNSVTNSTYAVVYSPKSFADVKGYWGEVAINDLYSRHILEGLGTKFNPGSTLTRGDFIVWLTKAMGIYRKGAGVASYSDVASSSTYYDAVSIAKRYHLINGRSSSKFSPNKEITRQEAIVILSKALNLTGSKVKKATAISSFLDNETITSWAIPATAKVLNNGTIVGYPSKTLRLTANMTRAEAATTIERLLLNAQLINRN
jgi:hypothetical protein